MVAYKAIAELIHLPAISLDDDVEGAGTAAEGGVDESLLVCGFPSSINLARLEGFGITDVRAKLFHVNEPLTAINGGPV